MARERPAKLAILESEKLIERAMNCHRLAVGVDHPQFTLKLSALAAEYEARAMALKGANNSFRTRPGGAAVPVCTSEQTPSHLTLSHVVRPQRKASNEKQHTEAVARFADGAEPTFRSRTRAVVAAHQDS
jgi:hypothetical protein